MFLSNSFQQISFFDKVHNMPKYLQNMLYNSWAHIFQEIIFPEINENRFEVLYSDKPSRPNSPVNVIIGALFLKEIFQLTDEQLLGSIFFDDRFQYALRLTSEERPPVSFNTFTNFRNRVYAYYNLTGIDLIQQEVESLSRLIAEHLNIDGQKVRMDSFMVSSSCKNLSRIELVYTVNYQFIKMLAQLSTELIPEECKSYLEKGHKNETIYRTKDSESETKLEFLLKQAGELYNSGLEAGKKVIETEEFKTLKRMLGEQTKDDDNFNIVEPKESKNIASDSLQNPSDPDATYRFKYGSNIGYTANVVEIFDENGSIITNYDLKPNIYSDKHFSSDIIEILSDIYDDATTNDSEDKISNTLENPDKIEQINSSIQEENTALIQIFIDGAYYSFDLAKKALSLGIILIPGELTGRKPAEDKMSYASFKVNEQEKVITECANEKEPVKSEFNEDTDTYTAKFNKEDCHGCPHKESCRVKEQVKYNSIRFSEQQYATAKLREEMETKEYIKLTSQRAGVEGIPSVFRRVYNVDNMPVRGLVRSKIWFGIKVMASNVKKLFKSVKLAGI